MRAILVVAMGMLAVGSGALGARRGPAVETPRATDLLRAERMAEEVEERRRLPSPAHRSGWKRGGTGFGDSHPTRDRAPRDIIINVRPPSRRLHGAP